MANLAIVDGDPLTDQQGRGHREVPGEECPCIFGQRVNGAFNGEGDMRGGWFDHSREGSLDDNVPTLLMIRWAGVPGERPRIEMSRRLLNIPTEGNGISETAY
jgi:hypothetical protein